VSCDHPERHVHTFDVLYCEGEQLEWCEGCGALRVRPEGDWRTPATRRDTQPTLDNPTTDPPPPMGDEPREAS